MATELPPGFVLDVPKDTAGLPEGFVLDEPLIKQPEELPAGSMPQGFNLDTPRKKEVYAEAEKRGLVGMLKGAGEVGLTVASSAIAEPAAGFMGLQTGLEPGAVETTREAMTYMPKSEAGQEYLGELGELMEPIGEWFKGVETELGDRAFEITDSPAIAAAATTIPTAIIEALGLGAGKKLISGVKNIKKARSSGKIARSISEAAPTKDQLFNVASKIYDEIDESGAVIKADKFDGLVDKLSKVTKKSGLHPKLTKKSYTVMDEFLGKRGTDIKVTDVDILRKQAKLAAKNSADPPDASLGVKIIDEVDDFFADLTDEDFITTGGLEPTDIGAKYKVAQDLWGRARKSEMLDRAFRRAREANSGMENGIRNEFKSILLSDKKRKFFDKAELEAMEKVSRGDKSANIAKLIGKMGWSEGKATGFLGASIAASAGFAAGGPLALPVLPLIGQVSKKLAQRLTVNNAEFANQVIRAGKNAKKITEAYLDNTAPALRSAEELSELLMRQDVKLNRLPKTKLAQDTKKIVVENKAKLNEIDDIETIQSIKDKETELGYLEQDVVDAEMKVTEADKILSKYRGKAPYRGGISIHKKSGLDKINYETELKESGLSDYFFTKDKNVSALDQLAHDAKISEDELITRLLQAQDMSRSGREFIKDSKSTIKTLNSEMDDLLKKGKAHLEERE